LKRIAKELGEGYKTFYIKGGEKFYLKGVAPRGKAIKKGASFVLGNLRATFGVEKTRMLTQAKDINYQTERNVFRDYRISGAKRIPLKDLWIQKAGTRKEGVTIKGARLRSRGERQEIQSYFKKQSNKKNKLLNWI